MKRNLQAMLALLVLFTLAGGCKKPQEKQPAAPTAHATPASAAAFSTGGDFSSRTDKLKFRDGSGHPVFSLKLKGDGAKLVDASEAELARLKIEKRPDGTELKIKSADEKTLGTLTGSAPRWKLKDADKKTLFEIRREADGSLKIQDGSEKTVYRIQARNNEAEVEDGNQAAVVNLKTEAAKTLVRDSSGKVVLMTTDAATPQAIVFFALDGFSKPQAAALFLTFNAANQP